MAISNAGLTPGLRASIDELVTGDGPVTDVPTDPAVTDLYEALREREVRDYLVRCACDGHRARRVLRLAVVCGRAAVDAQRKAAAYSVAGLVALMLDLPNHCASYLGEALGAVPDYRLARLAAMGLVMRMPAETAQRLAHGGDGDHAFS